MSQDTIGQRLKILISQLGLDIKGFCQRLDISETTVRNYFSRGNNPNADFLSKLTNTFEYVNLNWLLTGKGAPFLASLQSTDEPLVNYTKNNFGKNSNVGINSGAGTQHIGAGEAAKNLEAAQLEIEGLRAQLESLRAQLEAANIVAQSKDAVIAAKEETITLLRATYNRPN